MPTTTQDQTLYRGDWILEHLAAIHLNQINWNEHTHTNYNPRTPGAYHQLHDHYDPDLLPQPNIPTPRYYTLHIPREPRINQPNETHTTTPTWARQLTQHLEEIDALTHFNDYIHNLTPNTQPLAYYDQTTQRMRYGKHPNPLLKAIHLASASLPPNLAYPNETT